MKTNDELIQDYIKKVTRNLGSKQRIEVARELEAHILDSADALAAERKVEVDENIIRDVIKRMGSPDEVAALYPKEKTFRDNITDVLKFIGRFTILFVIVFTIIWIILWLILGFGFSIKGLIIFIVVYVILLTIRLLFGYKIFPIDKN